MFDTLLRERSQTREAIVGSVLAILATGVFGVYLTVSEGIALSLLPIVLFTTVVLAPLLGPLGWLLGSATAKVAKKGSITLLIAWALFIGATAGWVGLAGFWLFSGLRVAELLFPVLAYSVVVSLAFSLWVSSRAHHGLSRE